MEHIWIKDKGLEKAIKEDLNLSSEEITKDDLLQYSGIIVTGVDMIGFKTPWQSRSNVLEGRNLIFNILHSENGLWVDDLKHFLHIHNLVILEPIENLEFLKDFVKLQELYIKYNTCQDWSFLLYLHQLKCLFLRKCHFPDLVIIRDLCAIQEQLIKQDLQAKEEMVPNRLTHLGITYSHLSDLSVLRECKHFVELNFSHNEITEIAPLLTMQNLEFLQLRYNLIHDLEMVKNMKKIQLLDVRSNKISNIEALSKAKNLKYLFLSNNDIEDFSPLQNLDLEYDDITR